jgi:hypothetical protein
MPYGKRDSDELIAMAVVWGVILLIIGFFMWWSISEKRAFMADCERHKPRFECTALWKASRPDTVTVYTRD